MPYSNHGRPWATVGGHICWFTVTYCLSNRFLLQYALQICQIPTLGDRGRPWAVTSVGSRSLIGSAKGSCYSMICEYAMFQPWVTVGDRGRPWAVTSVGSRSLIASAIDSCYSMHCKYAMFQPWATVGDRGRSNLLFHGHLLPQQ